MLISFQQDKEFQQEKSQFLSEGEGEMNPMVWMRPSDYDTSQSNTFEQVLWLNIRKAEEYVGYT